jgi:hypothetical protein
MKNMRNEIIMFLFFMGLLVLLFYKLVADRVIEYSRPTEKRIIESNCDEPKDYAKEKWLSKDQRQYYEYLYDKTE